ncbi:MAG: aspartate aminotransferase family protein [Acidilobaceae archaeon]
MLRYLSFFEQRGIEISKAKGQYVWDSEGNKYLDFHTGHGVAFLGHGHPKIVSELKKQLDIVAVATPSFKVKIREEVLQELETIMPSYLSDVTFFNSGAEAVEFALKLARKATGKKKLIGFINSFHGRTFGALSVTGNHKYRAPFEPLLPNVELLRFNSIEDLEKIDGETAGVIVEPIQGEGGVVPASPDFMKALENKTKSVGALLILDEVQTGFGRTGAVWAHEIYNVKPDVLIAGKSIGGGFPVSLVAMIQEASSKISLGDHGSTFGGNPLACAAVKAAVEVLVEEDVPSKAREAGRKLFSRLVEATKGKELVRSVRGAGLMIGVELRVPPTNVIKCLQEKGRVLALRAGSTVVRFLPPYMISDEDINWGVEALARCIDEEQSSRSFD